MKRAYFYNPLNQTHNVSLTIGNGGAYRFMAARGASNESVDADLPRLKRDLWRWCASVLRHYHQKRQGEMG